MLVYEVLTIISVTTGLLVCNLGPKKLATESEVWAAVLADPSLVIIDSSLMPLPEGAVNPPPTLNLTIGSPILISDPTNLG